MYGDLMILRLVQTLDFCEKDVIPPFFILRCFIVGIFFLAKRDTIDAIHYELTLVHK